MPAFRRMGLVIGYCIASGCGGGDTTTPTRSPDPVLAATVVAASSIQFRPPTVSLVQGGTVTFQFEGVEHNVFFDNDPQGAPDNIATPTANKSVTRTFNTPGRYGYYCHIHPEMSGVVVVQ